MKRNSKGWTPERRKKQSEKIKNWKPWEHSTGPRTEAGKQKTSQNAYAHGFRSKDMLEIADLLRWQKNFVKSVLNDITRGTALQAPQAHAPTPQPPARADRPANGR